MNLDKLGRNRFVRSIIALAMSFMMTLSTCAPTVSAFADDSLSVEIEQSEGTDGEGITEDGVEGGTEGETQGTVEEGGEENPEGTTETEGTTEAGETEIKEEGQEVVIDDNQKIVFDSYSENAPISAEISVLSFDGENLSLSSVITVSGDEGVEGVYDGLEAVVLDAEGNQADSRTLPEMGVGSSETFTTEISGEALGDFMGIVTGANLSVTYNGVAVASASLSQPAFTTLESTVDPIIASLEGIGENEIIATNTGLKEPVSIFFSAAYVANVTSMIIALPKGSAEIEADLSSFTSVTATAGIVEDFDLPGVGVGDYYIIVIPVSNAATSTSVIANYSYPNGTTAHGTSDTITAYVMQGSNATDGTGLLGSGYVVAENAFVAKTVDATFKAVANDNISIIETVESATDGITFTDLKERNYTQVVEGSDDEYAVVYQINANTDGSGATGRIYQESVVITNKISGYHENGKPTSIVVTKLGSTTPILTVDPSAIGDPSTTFSFAAELGEDGLFNSQQYLVTVKYSKNAYTKRTDGGTSYITDLTTVTSSATIKSTSKLAGASEVTATSESVTNTFGYKQQEPTLPTLSLQKKLYVLGKSVNYDSTQQAIYGDSTNVVKFSLTKAGGTSVPIAIDGSGRISFGTLEPSTTYTLSETQGVSDLFTKVEDTTIEVSAVKSDGTCDVTVTAPTGVTSTKTGVNTLINVTNTASSVAQVKVTVKKQNANEFGDTAAYSIYPGATVELWSGTDKIATATADTNGIATFNNVEAGKAYTVKGGAVEYHTVETVSLGTIANGDVKECELLYNCAFGSFKLQKMFKDPDGNTVSETNYTVTFNLYVQNPDGSRGAAATDLKGNAISPITITSSDTSAIVDKMIPSGTYILEETALTVGGTDGTDRYAMYSGNNITVTVENGKFNAIPVGTGDAASFVDNGKIVNKSIAGTFKIQSFTIDGNLTNSILYKVTGPNSYEKTFTPANGLVTAVVPAGAYTVTPVLPTGWVTIDSESTTITVAGSTVASAGYTVSSDGKTIEGTATQTAAFIHALLPNYSNTKVSSTNAATKINNAKFVLYAQNSNGTYSPYPSKANAMTTTSYSGGTISFNYLPVGEYLVVETVAATGYILPEYVAGFVDGTDLKENVNITTGDASKIPAENKFTVAFSDYKAVSPANTIKPSPITNVPLAKITLSTVSADKGTTIVGNYTLTKEGESTPLASNATAAQIGALGLAAGNYVLKQDTVTDGYYVRTDEVKITVNANGEISVTNTDEIKAGYPNTAVTENTADKSKITVVISNYPKVKITFSKVGETREYDDNGDKVKAPLPGAKFKIYYKENGDQGKVTKHYLKTDGTYTTNKDDADIKVYTSVQTGTIGAAQFTVSELDPTVSTTYYLDETYAPDYQGVEGSLSIPYYTGTWKITLQKNNSGAYDVKVGKQKVGSDSSAEPETEGEVDVTTNASVTLTNKFKTYNFKLQKSMMTSDGNNGWIEDDSAPAINGVFYVYKLGDGWNGDFSSLNGKYNGEETGTARKPDDTLVTGTGGLGNANTAYSSYLPAGKYVVIEIQAPIGAKSATSSQIFTEDTNGNLVPQSGNKVVINGVSYPAFIVELGENTTYDDENPFKIGNELESKGGTVRFVRLYGKKSGWSVQADGTMVYKSELAGVTFEVKAAYKDADGVYHEMDIVDSLGNEMEVESGSLQAEGIVKSAFLTPFISMSEIRAKCVADLQKNNSALTDEQALGQANEMQYALVLVEKGPVPSAYKSVKEQIDSGNYPKYYYDIPFEFDKDWTTGEPIGTFIGNTGLSVATMVQTSAADKTVIVEGAPTATTAPIDVKNVSGTVAMSISKLLGGATPTEAQNAEVEFEVYYGTSSDYSQAVLLKTVNPGSGTFEYLPGHYWVKEVKAASGYNNYGTYTAKVTGKSASSNKNATNIAFGSNSTVNTNSFMLEDGETLALTVNDYPLAGLELYNYWDGKKITDTTYTATYTLTKVGETGSTDYTVTGGTAKTITDLANGSYTLVTKSTECGNNYSNNGSTITFDVASGVVSNVKAAGVDPGELLNFPASGVGYNGTLAKVTGLNINHAIKGALVVNKGYISQIGAKLNVSDAMTAVSFKVEKVNDSTGEVITGAGAVEKIYNWTSTAQPQLFLDKGYYKVTETGAVTDSSTAYDFNIDSTPVFIYVDDLDIVYLTNATEEKGGTVSTPLNATNTNASTYFYNPIDLGRLEVRKINGSKTETDLLAGAEFKLYTKNGETYSEVMVGETTNAVAFTPSSGKYTVDVPEGTYYVKETKAPEHFSAREEYFEVYVKANTNASYDALDSANNVNSIGIVNAPLLNISVAKETEYPEISYNGTVLSAAKTTRVGDMGVQLYKKNVDKFEPCGGLKTTAVTEGEGRVSGEVDFTDLDVGTYKIVEILPKNHSLDYLALNTNYSSLEGAKEFTIAYDNATKSLKLDGTNLGNDWDATESLLTITNQFNGLLIAVQKYDYDDQAKGLAGAKFDLFSDAACETEVDHIAEIETDTDGLALFTPMYTTANTDYYVKEIQAPSGYIVNDGTFDDQIKKVTTTSTGGTEVIVVEFLNKKLPDAPKPTITKESSKTTVDPITETGFDTVYTLTPGADKLNEINYVNYKIVDNGPKFLTNASAEITGPTYELTEVKVYGTTSKNGVNTAVAPVYARVNGGAWKLLSADSSVATTFDLNGNNQDVTVEYSTSNAATNNPMTTGFEFTPGVIEVSATFDKYTPADATQKEVAAIRNAAVTTATYNGVQLTANTSATITVNAAGRSTMAVSKVLHTTEAQNPSNENAAFEYTIGMSNTNASVNITHPIFVDVMQEDAMYLKQDSAGEYIYTAKLIKADTTESDVTQYAEVDVPQTGGGSIVVWSFPSLVLEPGDKLTVSYTAGMPKLVQDANNILENFVYGTSGKDLIVSAEYPTGASFVADASNSFVSSKANVSEYTTIDGYFTGSAFGSIGSRGMYVKASDINAKITSPNAMTALKSIKVGASSAWNSTTTPVDAYPGDTIYYRLQFVNQSGSDTSKAENIQIVDVLPYLNDTYSITGGGSRGTQWSNALTSSWIHDLVATGNFTVTKNGLPVSGYKVHLSSGNTLSSALNPANEVSVLSRATTTVQSFWIELPAGTILAKDDVLEVVYSVKLPEWADFDDTMKTDVSKLAAATYTPVHNRSAAYVDNMESNVVYARLQAPPAKVKGTVWNDEDRNGTIDTTEGGIEGVTVTLYKTMDSGLTWDEVEDTTTVAGGTYEFDEIVASYGANAPGYKVVVSNPDDDVYRFTPVNTAYVDDTLTAGSTASHMMNINAGHTFADTTGILVKEGGIVNAGLYELNTNLTVTYTQGSASFIASLPSTAAANATNMPEGDLTPTATPQVYAHTEGETHTVPTVTPTWVGSGYTFAGWKVISTNDPALNTDTAHYGNVEADFTMPSDNVVLEAQWTINGSYSVTYLEGSVGTLPTGASANAIDIPATATGIVAGTQYNVVMSPTPTWAGSGYTFTGWKVTGNTATGSDPTIDTSYTTAGSNFTMPAGNVTLTAQWTQNTLYNVTYAPGNAGTQVGDMPLEPSRSVSVAESANYVVETGIPTWYGHTFAGWKVTDGDGGVLNTATNYYGNTSSLLDNPATKGNFTMPSNNVTLTAQWSLDDYNVTYVNGLPTASTETVTNMPTDSLNVNALSVYTVGTDVPVRTGYTFKGWEVTTTPITVGPGTYTPEMPTTGGKYKDAEGANLGSFTMPAQDIELKALWKLNGYTVTYLDGLTGAELAADVVTNMPNSAAAGDPESTVFDVAYGATHDVENLATDGKPVRYGYTFDGWKVTLNEAGSGITPEVNDIYNTDGANFSMPAGNVELTAQWSLNKYKITYVDGLTPAQSTAGEVVDNMPNPDVINDVDALSSQTVDATLPTRIGYDFAGWKVIETASDLVTYTPAMPNVDDMYRVPDATDTPTTFTMPDHDVTFEAQWTAIKYKVTYLDGKPSESIETVTNMPNSTAAGDPASTVFEVAYDTTHKVEKLDVNDTPALYGYTFDGWKVTVNGSAVADDEPVLDTIFATANDNFQMPAGDVELTAQWSLAKYDVTYVDGLTAEERAAEPAVGLPLDENNDEIDALSEYTIDTTVPTRYGYTFIGWQVTTLVTPGLGTYDPVMPAQDDKYAEVDVVDTPTTFTMPAQDVELKALWKANEYTVTYEDGLQAGDKGTVTNMPNSAADGEPESTVFTENYKDTHDIEKVATADPDDEDDIPARYGYVFVGWEVTVNDAPVDDEHPAPILPEIGVQFTTDGENFSMPAGNVTLTAIWEKLEFTVTYKDGLPEGSTDVVRDMPAVNPQTYSSWDQVTVENAPSRSQSRFLGWKVISTADTLEVENPLMPELDVIYQQADLFTMPAGDVVLEAVWRYLPDEEVYHVYYDPNGGSGEPTDSNDYYEGDIATVLSQEPVRHGYIFVKWVYDGGDYVGGDTITMPASDITLVAQWTPDDPKEPQKPDPEIPDPEIPDPEIPDPEPGPDPKPEIPVEYIDEDGTPLGDWEWDPVTEEWIFVPIETPLGDFVNTGDTSQTTANVAMMSTAAIALAVLLLRKRKEEEA